MGRRRCAAGSAVVLAGTVTGCAQIAGIEETSGLVEDTETVSLTLDKALIGTTVITEPLDLTGLTATFLVPDETESDGLRDIEAVQGDPGTWTAEYTGTVPWVMFTLPDAPEPFYRIFETGTAATRNVYSVYGHPNIVPPMPADQLTVDVTLPTPLVTGEALQLYAVGPFGIRNFPAGELPLPDMGIAQVGPATFPYSQVQLFGAFEPFTRISALDAVLVLRHVDGRLTGLLEAAPFDQTGDDTITGTMIDNPAADTLNVTLDNTTIDARFAVVRPAMTGTTMSWVLNASTGVQYASTAGPQLASAVVTAASSPNVSAMYGNPFVGKGWSTVMVWRASATRSFTIPASTTPVTLTAALEQVVEPTAGVTLDHPAGLPELVTIGAQPLSSDGIMIPRPTRAVTVTFVVPPAPVNDLYTLTMFELVPDSAVLKNVVSITSLRPEFVIPPEFFTEGKYYTLRAASHAGSFPNKESGDFGTRSLPYTSASMDSGVFTVMAAP